MQSVSQRLAYWLKVVSLGMILGLGLQFAQAWVPPASDPPAVNVAGPITTSAIAQVKTGGITAGYLSSPTVCVNGDCRNAWPNGGGGGDNLGNHIANQNLNMSGNNIVNANQILATGVVSTQNSVLATNGIWTGGGVYVETTIDAKDYWIRSIGKWASDLYGGLPKNLYQCPTQGPAGYCPDGQLISSPSWASSACGGQLSTQTTCPIWWWNGSSVSSCNFNCAYIGKVPLQQ